ncbi:PAS domain-containing protein [Bacillus sp. EB600]|uniref:PAS domain-containing protein n=1 Tax=Bacillus sp. EB600 TaxID=2806345 RepID=UPI0035C09C0C|nr:PAS domain S-box protein [Bacillus sp. EB600]
MVTNTKGIIEKVNHAFTRVTGYTVNEVAGKKTNIFQSGKHDQTFYQKICDSIPKHGYWQGEIWNKRKDGETLLEWLIISKVNIGK